MILFDDAFGKTESESPTPFLCCEAWFEYPDHILFADALTAIGYVDDHLCGFIPDNNIDSTLAVHGVEGILQQVLDHPVE